MGLDETSDTQIIYVSAPRISWIWGNSSLGIQTHLQLIESGSPFDPLGEKEWKERIQIVWGNESHAGEPQVRAVDWLLE